MSHYIDQLDALRARLDTLGDSKKDEDEEEYGEPDTETLENCMQQVCDVVRSASAQSAGNMEEIVAKAQDIINMGINAAYGSDGMFDFIPSFAHGSGASLVKDKLGTGVGQGTLRVFLSIFGDLIDRAEESGSRPMPAALRGTQPWTSDSQTPAKSTRLARFRPVTRSSVTDAMPLAQTIYQARCEITDNRIASPSKMLISPENSCLAIIGAGGWKNRDPMLHCYLLDDDDHMQKGKCFSPGFSELAYTMAMDEERKLVFVADTDRVKSFSWDVHPDLRINSFGRGGLPPVHTLDSGECEGWVAILPNGRVVRAGHGKAFMWNIDSLEQHGPDKKRIGAGEYDTEDSWRDNDDGDAIEDSTGSIHHTLIAFADPAFYPAVWHRHVPTGNMLCGTSGERDGLYACASLDLEHGGAIVARYLGHGGDVEDISTSDGDSHTFATAGSDGYARLYDVRQPLPVITFDHGCLSEYCSSVVLIHPDGVPTLFSAATKSEQIKMWDIRAKEAVYELATGNNAIASMAWDSKRSALYAATECMYMDRLGFNHDYRRARIPRWADEHAREPEEDDEEDTYEDEEVMDDDEDDELDRCWPQRAHHSESYFGYAFDAGDHRIYRYAFKENPDPKQLPAYGEARTRQSSW